MAELSETTRRVIEKMFAPERRVEVEELLVKQGNSRALHLSFDSDRERIHLAVLKRSEGRLDLLKGAIKLAQTDYRDALMGAGFGNDIERHKVWAQKFLSNEYGPEDG